jgi:hypothetical protein
MDSNMNKVYKIVWNHHLFCWKVTSELAKSHSSNNRTSTATGDVAKTGNSKNKIRTRFWFQLVQFKKMASTG